MLFRSPSDIPQIYRQAIGHLVVDLTDVRGNNEISVAIQQGIGQLEIIVPDDADVFATSRVGAGDLAIFGASTNGGYRQQSTAHSRGAGRTIRVAAKLGLGEISLRRAMHSTTQGGAR